MSRRSTSGRNRERRVFGIRARERLHRLAFEVLEDRTMMDAGLPVAIVVGRTLTVPQLSTTQPSAPSYFVGEVQNNQVAITYTVYNEQADPETGVLLTTTLAPGVTIDSASVASGATTLVPDQQGQNLAWSLGTINGFDRAGVTLVVDLANSSILQLDSGAQVVATLDAGGVSNTTPPALLRPGNVSAPSLLASTPDANTTDPFIQEEAAELGYDPQQIFNFLHTQIGYNSYLGSVRGARGTLWSDAGNALDVASLGVALMRASGIPAQYVEGTLSQSQAQQLILSMFPSPLIVSGLVPASATISDPANDPQLLAETENHYWFQFDAGAGMMDADPLIAGATIGQAFTAPTGTFAEVPDALREKTTVTLTAEITNTASSLFGGLGGGGATTSTVLTHTFNDVDLVGRPLTVGNLVSSNSINALIASATSNTYSPYIEVGDYAYQTITDEFIRGTDYQETLTSLPFGSQVLTGLFLNLTVSGPQGPSESYDRTLFDAIGYDARLHGGAAALSIDPAAGPSISPFDLTTINALPGLFARCMPSARRSTRLPQVQQMIAAEAGAAVQTATDAGALAIRNMVLAARMIGANFLLASDLGTKDDTIRRRRGQGVLRPPPAHPGLLSLPGR